MKVHMFVVVFMFGAGGGAGGVVCGAVEVYDPVDDAFLFEGF